MITIKTSLGEIQIELDEKNTPKTAENFKRYAREQFFDNTIFHRVISNFMNQGGGFTPGMERKETHAPIENEADKGGSNLRGTIAMARTNDPHSATAQFFVNVVDNLFLDFKAKNEQGWGYCVFGRVVDGMDVVDKINAVKTTTRSGHRDVPVEDVVIDKVVGDTIKNLL